MKIYLSNYRYHWISPYTILEHIFFWTDWSKCGRNKGVIEDKDYVDHPEWVERWANRITPISTAIRVVLDFIHPPIKYVKIDRWDTWSMDHTLSYIILPMLKQLSETKHGAPYTEDFFDDSECGDEKFPWDKDGQYLSKIKVDNEGLEAHQKRKANGFKLFGKYYQNLWD